MKTLQDIKVGDTVILNQQGLGRTGEKVTAVTKTMITIGTLDCPAAERDRFRKSDGFRSNGDNMDGLMGWDSIKVAGE